MLVSDVTWISDGVSFNNGVVVSYRDKNIPRKSFINSIRHLLIENKLKFQDEVEAYGSSDAREIQLSPYPIDWCFIGAPIENAHTNQEKVHKHDLHSMISCYKILMENL
jgi:putative aminopeptidase FrvX